MAGTPHRRQVVGPILIYHREDGDDVYIVHVRRGEMKREDLSNEGKARLLKLHVRAKSEVVFPWDEKISGFSFAVG